MAENKDKKNKSVSNENGSNTEKPKVAKVVALRNRFFFMLYRNSSLVFLTSLISMCCALFFLFFFARQPVPPQYIPVNEDGTYIKLDPLSKCKEDREVQRFVNEAISKLYKYDYINYADQIQSAIPYFTTNGWNEYMDGFKNSGTLSSVKENKYVVTVQPSDVPQITRRWDDNGVCTWELKTQISIMYVGANSQNPKGDLYLRVVRNSVINSPDGLGITKVVFAESK